MDLRSVLNTSDNGDRGRPKASPPPPAQHQTRMSPHSVQYKPREYGQPQPPAQSHQSPNKPLGREYLRHQQQPPAPGAYPPPPSYQTHGPPLGSRPSQTSHSHHQAMFHDARPPGSVSVPARSPYRPSPTTVNAPGGPGYPFPASKPNSDIPSPDQRHSYVPGIYPPLHQSPQDVFLQRDHRDQMHSSGNYTQQQQVPQTPPFNSVSGQPQMYYHQRSQSAQSTPTPTSVNSQPQYGPAHSHGSPVLAKQSSTDFRPPSQPQTPLGPTHNAIGSRPTPAPQTNFTQPSSPYQQRTTSTGNGQPPQSPAFAATSSRRISGPGHQEQVGSEVPQPPKSLHSREPSLSVSPRTRVASTASTSDRAIASPVDHEKRPLPVAHHLQVDKEGAGLPSKRKLDDRNASQSELEHKQFRPPSGESNGIEQSQAKRRRIEKPIHAESVLKMGHGSLNHPNFTMNDKKPSQINGKTEGGGKVDRSSRPPSRPPSAEAGPQAILGPWEASITGFKPYEEMSKTVADFIFINVVNNPDIEEITSRGIHFEIEAKLGTLIDKDTNNRVNRLLKTECILDDDGRVAFKSSMTEAHHKAFNNFLNDIVLQTDPRGATGRVPVHYEHRHEVDRYYELPPGMRNRLPGCVTSRLGSRARNVKARVTYDQGTGQVLNKIVKVRVADIDIHMPTSPMDCRLSINLEMNWDGPSEELEKLGPPQHDKSSERQKDRLSYTQGHYQIDLTQVTLFNSGPRSTQRTDKEHELEIELHPPTVLDQGAKAKSGAPHRYQELIEGLLDNVRVLARKALEFG